MSTWRCATERPRSFRARRRCRLTTRASFSRGELGALGPKPVRGHLENPNGAPAHAIATPAEDHGVDPTGQDPLQQYLALFLVEEPADKEVHQAGRSYHAVPDNSQESQLRLCEMASSRRAARMKSFSVRPPAACVQSQMVSEP